MPTTLTNPAADLRQPVSATLCSHCRLPVPPGLIRANEPHQFCCHGCETAYAVINSCGLDNYYRLLDRTSETDTGRAPAKTTRRAYAEFDDPTFRSLYCRPLPDGLLTTELLLEGVHCAACVWLVEKLPQVVPGVAESRLDLRRATVHISFDPAQTTLSRIGRTLDSLGYPPHPARGPLARETRRREDRRMLVRMAVAGACAGNIMLLFFALYAGMFEGIEHGYEQLFRWSACVLNTICLAWPALVFARSALAALRTRTIHLDVPIALGLYLGGAWGIYKTIAGQGDIYFDSISALVFFLLVGRYIQQRQQRYAADAMELLFSLTPAVARKVVGSDEGEGPGSGASSLRHSATPSLDRTIDIPTEALKPLDIVEIRPGDCAPADGVVIAGASSVDLSLLTGESRPVRIAIGDAIAAGSVNLSSILRVRVEATGESTRIGKLMRMVEEASLRRAAIVKLADRWGSWLLWILLALAAATIAIWWHAGPSIAIDRAAALLIATCPCGLGLATPMAMTIAIGRAARQGILIKGGDALQALASGMGLPAHVRASSPGGLVGTLTSGQEPRPAAGAATWAKRPTPPPTILLDKTGTITLGKLSLIRWTGDETIKPLIAAIESNSSHPIAQALARDLSSSTAHSPLPTAFALTNHPGAGLSAATPADSILIGTRKLLESHHARIDDAFDAAALHAVNAALTPVYIARNGACIALAALGDPIRPDARPSIDALRARGWRVRILSGDHPDLVASVGRSLGLAPADCRGGVTPESKLAAVRDLATQGPVVMVGDGVNDAAALAAATVGIAVRGGAEASLAAADISLARGGLAPIVDLLEGARRTMGTIHHTIAASLAYNVLAAGLSMAGLISPLLAAFIMPASSLTVVALCLRSRAFRLAATPAMPAPSVSPAAPHQHSGGGTPAPAVIALAQEAVA